MYSEQIMARYLLNGLRTWNMEDTLGPFRMVDIRQNTVLQERVYTSWGIRTRERGKVLDVPKRPNQKPEVLHTLHQ